MSLPIIRWKPPIPPVLNTWTPAISAIRAVAATVVDALRLNAIGNAMSKDDDFSTSFACANASSSAFVRPTWILPSKIAIVAGSTPYFNERSSSSFWVSKLVGYGKPCVIMVDSKASTGLLRATARKMLGLSIRFLLNKSYVGVLASIKTIAKSSTICKYVTIFFTGQPLIFLHCFLQHPPSLTATCFGIFNGVVISLDKSFLLLLWLNLW